MSGAPDAEAARPLPQSMEAERAVLGGIMLDGSQALAIAELIEPADFYSDRHRSLYQLLLAMAQADQPTELLAVVDRLVASGTAEEVGGISYVSALVDQVPSVESLEYYARVVRQRAVSRRLIQASREIADRAIGGSDELAELLDFAESSIFQVTQQRAAQDWHALSEVVDHEFVRIEALSKAFVEAGGHRTLTGVTTGFIDLDRKLSGFQATDMVVLAARPAMGKTALALNFARAAAMSGAGVGIFSLEMSKGQLATRLLTSAARVDAGRIRTGDLGRDTDWPRLRDAAEELYQLPLHIDDSPGLTITQVRSKCRRLKSRHPEIRLFILDYIGLMSGDPKVSRQEQISTASRGIKLIAKELDVTFLCLSQLNRGVEARPNKRPVLSDLRESGAIEQDADIIMFIYRDEYYNPETTAEPGVAEVIIAKQRNGPIGTVKLSWQGEHSLFGNLAHESSYL